MVGQIPTYPLQSIGLIPMVFVFVFGLLIFSVGLVWWLIHDRMHGHMRRLRSVERARDEIKERELRLRKAWEEEMMRSVYGSVEEIPNES